MDGTSRRRFLRSAGIAAGLAATGARVSRARAQGGKPYAGTRIKMSQVSHAYAVELIAKLPAFEQQTGIKVEIDQMSFPVLNQREDLELASGSGAYASRRRRAPCAAVSGPAPATGATRR